ncbi:MAG: peptide chain release factor N(5)-glutamine methyltransferase [Gammaproteobacteria bacterium]|nr:peptide chain release factor N(5)-glutamine methyltransferase [Gammaproteobacteria bacterium]
MTIDSALADATARLSATDAARLEAELLLAAVVGQTRTYLYTWPERELTAPQQQRYAALVARRAMGEPLAHILGRREFWSLELRVTADTLIPRPETELLVEAALARLPPAGGRVADLGTGSGAIALALARECPACEVVAVERSAGALAVAEENACCNGIANVTFLHGSWYEPLKRGRFAMIVSNPPYICADDPHLKRGDLRFEPLSALSSGADGLDDLRLIIDGAGAHLLPGGWLLLEHGYDQGAAVTALLRAAGFAAVADLPDLQGHGRVAVGQFSAT